MKTDSSLYELIQSLSPSEKGNFKKLSKKGGATSKSYLRIFDAYAAQAEWEEEEVKKRAGYKSPTQFSVAKHYLFHSILDALVESKPKTESTDPINCLAKAKVLFDRAFNIAAIKLVEKGIRGATLSEEHLLLFELLNLEQLIWPFLPKEYRRSLPDIMDEKNTTLEKIRFTEYARQLNAKMLLLYQTIGVGRSEADIERYRSIFDDASTILGQPAFGGTITGGIYLLNCQVFYHNIMGDLQESLKDIHSLLKLLDDNPGVRTPNLTLYISSVNNLALLHLYLLEFSEAEELISRLEQLPSSSLKERNAIFVCRYNTRFELFEKKGAIEKAYQLTLELKKELPVFSKRLSEQYTGHLLYYSFRACFYAEKFRDAQLWLNEILRAGSRAKPEVVAIARISEMILHYERSNFDSISQLVSSAERHFEKSNTLYKFEQLMLSFFKKHGSFEAPSEAFAELQKELRRLESDPLEQKVFTYFDLSAWTESRIRRKPMSAIMNTKKKIDEKN